MSKRTLPVIVQRPSLLNATTPSVFVLTFVIEVVDIDLWHDCNEGWIELGPPSHGVRLSYQLYTGYTFDVDVMIWPHVAKVSCGLNYSWVRTWQFLQRRWLTFSIRHMFPVNVMDMRNFVATVTPYYGIGALSANAKAVQFTEVYLPPLRFGDRRQFAEAQDSEMYNTDLNEYMKEMIWSLVVHYIPSSFIDGPFDTPYPVQDVRHQDAVLDHVQYLILNGRKEEEYEKRASVRITPPEKMRLSIKDIKKQPVIEKKYEIKLSGDWILAGIGRVTPFVVTGDPPSEQGVMIALISSVNLPAQDDLPVFYVNVCNLTDIPIQDLKKNGFTHIYTRWKISDEEHNSEQKSLQTKRPPTEVNFNDHHAVPLQSAVASDIMARFLDIPFRVEIRGIRIPPLVNTIPKLFGYEKSDRNYDVGAPPPMPNQDVDILIAQTKIDARALTKINGSVKAEFPVYPPETFVTTLEREEVCTNDVNAVRGKVKPVLIIQPSVILQAQMTLEVSLGLVGCKPKTNAVRYSRMFCLVYDRDPIMTLLHEIIEINESVMQTENKGGLLTGFALDTGDTVMLYVEGPREGEILRVWEKTEDYYPSVKPVFSTSTKYSCRLYPELLQAAVPFNIMKMSVPLSVLLGVTPIYARPALPLPSRSAVLKIGRLIASNFRSAPCCRAMPTAMELKSFKLELCVAPRPSGVFLSDMARIIPGSLEPY
ncbi:hypothetical protein PYW07_003231 [Mythimna separata]|uniref:Uncharacterized protein n=1 Tax=Mythimna separata TaxID=271217 RepID=A0AAD8DQN8_MYTSE|nr:hypothetical protein PYW07_003231 [Mythimna separata]